MKVALQLVALALIAVFAVFVLGLAKSASPRPLPPSPAAPAAATGTAAFEPATSTPPAAVSAPRPGDKVSSPLSFSGEAPGSWYFEAVFPVTVVDWDGRIIGEGQAHAQSDWIATGTVPFSGTADFTVPADTGPQSARGAVIFKNDNPSGDPSRDASVEIPVTFR
ncbi:MAG: hypothetical protein KGI69_01345 [Patescibacteria group bacterium]|nr:hypothetical protein [Patescibacteria group bacterium]